MRRCVIKKPQKKKKKKEEAMTRVGPQRHRKQTIK